MNDPYQKDNGGFGQWQNEQSPQMFNQMLSRGGATPYRNNPSGGKDRFAPPANGGINPNGMYTPRPEGGPPPMPNPYDPGRMGSPYGMPHNQGPLPPAPGPMRPGQIFPGGGNPGDGPGTFPPNGGDLPQAAPWWQGMHGNQMQGHPGGWPGHQGFGPPQPPIATENPIFPQRPNLRQPIQQEGNPGMGSVYGAQPFQWRT